MSLPDLAGPSGRADWKAILTEALPYTDLFLPNAEELHFMLDRPSFDRHAGAPVSVDELRHFAHRALGLGAKLVCVKAGDKGLYLASGSRSEGIGRAAPLNWAEWLNVELWAPCFQVEVAGTTGAGDATIAGLLMAWLRSMSPRDAVRAAVAVGASCCERPDAVSGVQSWDATEMRITRGWPTLPVELGDRWVDIDGVFART
jgi:sugar/nucleoside kinase (ribokinase family)